MNRYLTSIIGGKDQKHAKNIVLHVARWMSWITSKNLVQENLKVSARYFNSFLML